MRVSSRGLLLLLLLLLREVREQTRVNPHKICHAPHLGAEVLDEFEIAPVVGTNRVINGRKEEEQMHLVHQAEARPCSTERLKHLQALLGTQARAHSRVP